MEQGNILPVGANRFGLTTLSDFKDLFVEAKRKSNRLKASQDNGDHSLNPDMGTPIRQSPASVLVPVIGRPGHPTVLLTRRSDALSHHAGQVSFPGGRVEETDIDIVDTIVIAFALPLTLSLAFALALAIALALGKVCKKM